MRLSIEIQNSCSATLFHSNGFALAGIVCDEGWDKYGRYNDWMNCRQVEGQTTSVAGKFRVEDDRKGQIKSISKDPGTGAIIVERYGEGTTYYTRDVNGGYSPTLRY